MPFKVRYEDKQPAPVEEGLVVRHLIAGIDFAPIAAQVLVEKKAGVLPTLGQGFDGPRRGDYGAGLEFGVHRW